MTLRTQSLARIFHKLRALATPFSLTPCFSWVWKCHQRKNRFNGLPHTVETVETVPRHPKPLFTQLKQGVNESMLSRRASLCEISGLTLAAGLLLCAAMCAQAQLTTTV